MIEALLWDNDGILVDSETLFFETNRIAFSRLGIELTKEIWGKLYLGEGKKARDIAVILGAAPDRIHVTIEERNQQYLQHLRNVPPLLRPNARETLCQLSGRVKMAIVTGCRRHQLDLMHASSGLLGYFDAIITGDDCPNAKPHPELYLAGLKALRKVAERCLAIEDSPRGLAAAQAAGIPCIVVPTELTQNLDFTGALAVESDVSAVLKYLR